MHSDIDPGIFNNLLSGELDTQENDEGIIFRSKLYNTHKECVDDLKQATEYLMSTN